MLRRHPHSVALCHLTDDVTALVKKIHAQWFAIIKM